MATIVDSEGFKKAMGMLPTGVTVITTMQDQKLFGFTANSFTSVSLTPPLVSFCLDNASFSLSGFKRSNYFAVSILAENQENISRHFSQHNLHKFTNIPHRLGERTNCPLIDGAVCNVECLKVSEYNIGDHNLFIGEVINATINNNLNPLIYFMRSYRSFDD